MSDGAPDVHPASQTDPTPYEPARHPKPAQKLYDNIRQTAKIRFIAARRHEAHHKALTWTRTLAAVALLIAPVVQAVGLQTSLSIQEFALVQFALAAVVLVVGLLVGAESHDVKALRLHYCGMELMDLYEAIGSPGLETRGAVAVRYGAIKKGFENQDQIDYDVYCLQEWEKYYPRWRDRVVAKAAVTARRVWNFKVYVVLMILVSVGLWFVSRDTFRTYEAELSGDGTAQEDAQNGNP